MFNVKTYGATGDGVTLDSRSIQDAIDACHVHGEGEVLVPKGTYLCGTLILKDNVTLRLEEGATILGSTDLNDYSNPDHFVDAIGQDRGWCLIGIVDAENVGIVGEGTIDGQGLRTYFTNPRPFLVRCVRSQKVALEGVRLRDAGAWVCHLYQSKGITVQNVDIASHVNSNNDGIDIDSTQDVLIDGCTINTGDDAICIKATSPVATENVVVKNCTLTSSWGAFKLGTESMGDFKDITFRDSTITDTGGGAMKVLSVDGCRLENLTIDNIKVTNTDMTLAMRLGVRLNKYREEEARTPGCVKNVTISNVTSDTSAEGRLDAPTGIVISGEKTADATHWIEKVRLTNIAITVEGNGAVEEVPDILERTRKDNYPEYVFFFPEGSKKLFPAYGVYVRHVNDIVLENVEVITRNPDSRPLVHLEDAHNVTVDVKTNDGNGERVRMIDSTNEAVQ